MIKAGANREEINEIIRMAKEGIDSGAISKALRIVEETVKSFMDFDPLEYEKQEAAKARAEAEEAEEKRLLAEAGARVAVEKKGKK